MALVIGALWPRTARPSPAVQYPWSDYLCLRDWAIGRVWDHRPDVVGATSAGTREGLRSRPAELPGPRHCQPT